MRLSIPGSNLPNRSAVRRGAGVHRRGEVMIRVLVVRDEGYFGVPVRVLLESTPDIQYVGTLAFSDDLAQRAAEMWPTVIVIDTEYMVSQILPIAAEFRATIP